MADISQNEFEKSNGLSISDRINQCVLSTTFKLVNGIGPNYLITPKYFMYFSGLLEAI